MKYATFRYDTVEVENRLKSRLIVTEFRCLQLVETRKGKLTIILNFSSFNNIKRL